MILLDATPMDSSHRERGVGRFVAELVKALDRLEGPDRPDLRLLRLPGASDRLSSFPEWRPRRPFPRSGRPALRIAGLLWSLRKAPAGTVFHGTDPIALARPSRGRLLATVHDIIPLLYPDRYLPWRADAGSLRLAYSLWLPRALREADRIVTVSDEVGRTLQHRLGLPPGRMSTIHHGAPEVSQSVSAEETRATVAARLGTDPFVLTVGSVEWRKDVPTVLRAVGRLNAEGSRLRLLHAGRLWGREEEQLRRTASEAGARLEVAGYVDDAELAVLYATALAFAFPSRAEGFGLPLLEAMAQRCPVVANRSSCLPEVAGDAAFWHEPGDDLELSGILRRLGESPALADEFRGRGIARISKFRWSEAAESYARIYRELSGTRPI